MMPPTSPLPQPEGDVVPRPGSILILGGDRWLTMTGRILPEPLGYKVGLTPNTLNYWEDAAHRAGYATLDELIV